MTTDKLILEATLQRTGPAMPDALSPSNLADFLRFALGHLLDDFDYESSPASGSAIAARTIATIISAADERTHGGMS